MPHSSLYEILRTFNSDELKKFEDFVCSPYFNKKSGVTLLYTHIKKFSPEFTSPRLEMEKVWKALYPDREYNYGIYKNLIFDLTKLAEKFITLEYGERENVKLSYDLLDSLNEREIKNLFKTKFDSLEKYLAKYEKSNEFVVESYLVMSKIYLLKFGFSNQFDRHSRMTDDFEKHSVFSASYLLYSIFHTSINALNFSKDYIYQKEENPLLSFLKKADSNNLIFELLESIKLKSCEAYQILNAYYKYYKSVEDCTSIEKYFDFKETLRTNAHDFSNPNKHILYSGLRNSILRIISPEINKSNEIVDIAKNKIRDQVMLNPDGFMSESEFVSSIQAACDINDSVFVNDFTDKFITYLPKDTRQNMLKYSLSNFYFINKQFEKSLEEILTLKYDLFIMKYYVKDLQMMNYYELNDYNSFQLLFDSYKHFLGSNKSITENWKNSQIEFSNILNKLFKLKERLNEFEIQNLENEITNSTVQKKQWLLRKVNELEKNRKKLG